MIECVGLTKRYGASRGVDDLTFSARAGEILGFLGPNGAGKTTTIRLLTGYFPPTAGTARVAGHDVVTDVQAARAAVGYLPENAPVYPNLSVEDYIDLLLRLKRPEARASARRVEVDRALEAVHLTGRRRQRIASLSKGLKRRAALAQAIVGDPRVVILDEPTEGLDPEQVLAVRALLRRLTAEGRTVMLSTHILSEVEALADRVVIVNEGRIVVQGRRDELCGGDSQRVELSVARSEVDGAPTIMSWDDAIAGLRAAIGTRWSLAEHDAGANGLATLTLAWRGDGTADGHDLADACRRAGLRVRELRHARVGLEQVFLRAVSGGPAARGPEN